VTCSGCGQANPADAQFCGGCGARLVVVCPGCQVPNPPGNRFCHQCGGPLVAKAVADRPAVDQFASPSAYPPKHLAEKILTTAGAIKGERKQVTVLFVDVSGFTSRSAGLDPEEVHRLMSRAFDLAREQHLVIPLLRCLWNEGLAASDLGEYDRSLVALEEGLTLAEKIGDDAYIPRFLNTIGWLRIECGDFAGGVELSELSYEVTGRSSRAGHGTGAERRAFIRNNQAEAWMVRGDLAATAEALDEAHHVVRHPPPSRWMTWRYSTQCYAGLGQLALLQGDPERDRRLADQSLEICVPTRSRKFESWVWRIKGESATARHAWDEALGRYRRAWALITRLRAATRDPGLRAGLESSPLIREVEDLARR
jgi:tetratricopeptide (TPR) repeat protein